MGVLAWLPSAVDIDRVRQEHRRAAIHAQDSTLRILDRFERMPTRAWIDLDGTLLNYRMRGEPLTRIVQGRIVGMMRAFVERQIPVGICSFWDTIDIHSFLNTRLDLDALIARDESGERMVRGYESINAFGAKLAMPSKNVHFVLRDRFAFYDFMPDHHDPVHRVPKFVAADELLIDDWFPRRHYEEPYLDFSVFVPGWSETLLAGALRTSQSRLVRVERVHPFTSVRLLSEAELARLAVVLTAMQE